MTRYAFDTRAPHASLQVACLERYLDPVTAQRLAPLVRPEARCWEVGAGGGSVARMLARSTGPDGLVVATDLDIAQLTGCSGMVARRHDVRWDPAPEGGPFDLIHARLVLLHLPERRNVLHTLASALAPGGWLVVEEFDCVPGPRVLRAANVAAEKLFTQVMDAMLDALRQRGADLGWAQDVYGEMALAGLTDIDSQMHAESWPGGSPGALLYQVNCHQLEPTLREAGLDLGVLRMFRMLMDDTQFAALSYPFVSTRGRRPL
jgi:2-polyprenyl-3-methyl-5-hydroxy-6-metoxy-1,4-benzoquinol methylase